MGEETLMSRRRRHSPAQIVERLREADALLNAGQSVAQVIQHLGVSEATYHRWRNQYGGMKAEEAKRLKELEGENARLKKLLADAELDKAVLKEAIEHLGKP
jgi:putative transposase